MIKFAATHSFGRIKMFKLANKQFLCPKRLLEIASQHKHSERFRFVSLWNFWFIHSLSCYFIYLFLFSFSFFLKMGHSRPLFLYSCLFYLKVHLVDKILPMLGFELLIWCQTRPLYQLSHHHCPSSRSVSVSASASRFSLSFFFLPLPFSNSITFNLKTSPFIFFSH